MTEEQKARWAEITRREEVLRALCDAHEMYRDDAARALATASRELMALTREKAAMLGVG
jgi:hypothetical protein